MSCRIALRRSPKPGAFTATALNVPRILLTTRVESASPSTSSAMISSGLAALRTFSSSGSRSWTVGDLALVHEHVGVLEDRFLALGVGHEVRGDVALVELHALGEVQLQRGRGGLLDRDDAVLADLVERVGEQLADGRVLRGDGGDVGDVALAVDLAGHREELVVDGVDGRVDPALEARGGRTGGDVAQTLVDQRLGQDGRGGGAVTGDVVGLGGDLLGELGAEVLERVVELDLAGDGHAVVGDRRRTPLLVDHDVAALGPEGDLDGVGERVDATLQRLAGGVVEQQLLGHVCGPFRSVASIGGGNRRRPGHPECGRPGRRGPAVAYLTTLASTSRAERISSSSPPYFTSVPPYLE